MLEEFEKEEHRSAPINEQEKNEYNQKVDKLLKPTPVEEKKPTEDEKKQIIQQAQQVMASQARAASNPVPENIVKAWQDVGNFASINAPQIPTKYVQSAVEKTGKDPLGAAWDAVQGAVAGIVDRAKSVADGIATFGRGVWYGIVGPPEDEDLSDEIAAVKGTGLGMMTVGGTAAAAGGIAAATGVGAPIAAALGGIGSSLSLLGLALTNRIAGRLESIQSQREIEKKKEEDRKADLDLYKQKMDTYLETSKMVTDYKTEAQKSIQQYYEQLKAEKEQTEEEKKQKEEKDRKYYAVTGEIKSYMNSAKSYITLAGNAYYAKNTQLALENLDAALEQVLMAEMEVDQNKELLEEYNSYDWLANALSSLENTINATKKTYLAQNPNRELQNAATKYNQSVYQYWNTQRKVTYRNMPADLGDPDTRKIIIMQYSQAVNDEAIAQMLNQLVQTFARVVPVVNYPPSKLDYMTIAKLRDWLATVYKTPLSAIPNYVWNNAAGKKYNADMLALMMDALEDAGVDPEEVESLKPYELEAILRARQYIWAAAQRGYWSPYELELYTRLKELLQLTDTEAAELFKVPELVLKPIVKAGAMKKYKSPESSEVTAEVVAG